MRFIRLVCALVPVILIGAGAHVDAAVRVPQGFVGMNLGPYVFDTALNPAKQFDRLVASGVETTRIVFSWADAQPYERWSDVPAGQAAEFQAGVGNVPTNFAETDGAVELAAAHGLTILPTVIYTPGWESQPHPVMDFGLPRSNETYADYVESLVRRYGPHGTFWTANPQIPYVPIRMWQIWNEPNTRTRWPMQPFAKTYVAMLGVTRRAIRRVDPNAKVVLAGLPNFSWKDLEKIYRVRGARRLFDVVAIHPYTASPQGVLTILKLAREVMKRYGDASKALIASETGWPSSLGHSPEHYPFDSTPQGEAKKLATLVPLLAKNRRQLRLLSFDIYTWLDTDAGHSFNYSGLLRVRGTTITAKPALAAFMRAALALEQCRRKGARASSCAVRSK